ncbi:MAG TPA: ATP-binding protein [Rhodoglobus sp.]|nr:ATP-binding protein [Rhodoglobus sp.]
MALGLPAHLRTTTFGTAYVRAAHTIAAVCLAAAIVVVATRQASDDGIVIWPALFALAALAALLWNADRYGTVAAGVLYLLAGLPLVYAVAWFAMTWIPGIHAGDAFLLTMLRVALGLVAVPAFHLVPALLWCVAGLLAAEAAITLAALQTGMPLAFDWTGFTLVAAVVALFATMNRLHLALIPAEPRLHRAADQESLAASRTDLEARAAAVLHDTVLGRLASIAASRPGPLSPAEGRGMRRELDALVGDDWLDDTEPQAVLPTGGPLARAVEDARELGLEVGVSGDVAALASLASAAATALAQAVGQCLVNVERHAGVHRADVVVSAAPDALSVLVVDAGRGFRESEVAPDRLGLRHSVRRRIEAVGGSVRVWSAPGRGTSVAIRVPTDQTVST